MGTYTAKTRTVGRRPRSKRLRELGGTVVKQAVEGNSGAGTADVDLSVYEKVANKVTTIDAQSTDEQYPSAKAVKTALGTILNDRAWDLVPENTPYGSTDKAPTVAAIRHAIGNWIMRRSAITNEWHEKNDGGRGYGLLADSDFWDDVDMTNEEPMPGEDGYEMPGEANVPSLASVRWAFAVILQMIDGITAAAPNAHTHAVTDIVNLQTILGGKAAASHTHVIADLTNAAALFTQFALNSGVVSLTIGGQQRSITLPTAATPSGDPMHYFYTELGCTYNTTTGLWTYRDLTDLTTEQVRASYVYTACVRNNLDRRAWGRSNVLPTTVRFTFNADGRMQENMPYSFARFMQYNAQIEYLYIQDSGGSYDYCNPNNIGYDGSIMCLRCTKLKKVATIFAAYGFVSASLTLTDARTSFNLCPQLTYLRLYNLGRNYAQSTYANTHKLRNYFWEGTPLDYDSLKFMVVNAANAIGINIWLSDTSYSYIENDTTAYTYNGASYTGLKALAAAKLIDLRKFSTDYDTTTPANSYASYLT